MVAAMLAGAIIACLSYAIGYGRGSRDRAQDPAASLPPSPPTPMGQLVDGFREYVRAVDGAVAGAV